jgi:hypothetical protein
MFPVTRPPFCPNIREFFQLQHGLPDGLVVQGQNTITLMKRYG